MILKTVVSVKPGVLFSGGTAREGHPHPLFAGTNGFDYTDEPVHKCHI